MKSQWLLHGTFSIRTLCILIAVVSLFLAYYAFQARKIRQHHAAMGQIEQLGGRPVWITAVGKVLRENNHATESTLDVMFGRPSLFLAGVDLTDPGLTEDDIRTMIPHMQKTILLQASEFNPEGTFIDAIGNGSFTPELVDAIRNQLPGYFFIRTTPLPNPTEHPIQIGMTTTQVELAVAKKMYDQRTDWVGDPAPILKNFGSIHETYRNADATVTWTYATHDIGVDMIVIDFDLNQRVAEISFSRGVPERLIVTPLTATHVFDFE